jgi:hypothetical protein
LAALVATLARGDELVRAEFAFALQRGRGWRAIEALAAGRSVPTPGWRSAWSAWRAVAGLR